MPDRDEFLPTINNRYLRQLYLYWRDRRGERAFPARRDLDPLDIRFIVGNLLLIDVQYDPLRFRCRLHGTNLSERAGYDMTGRMVDELPGEEANRKVLIDRLVWLLDWRRPFAISHSWRLDNEDFGYEVIWLPLSDDGERINMFWSGILYDDDPVPPAAKDLLIAYVRAGDGAMEPDGAIAPAATPDAPLQAAPVGEASTPTAPGAKAPADAGGE